MSSPNTEVEACHQLQCYTLAHPDPVFIHQYVVDAWAAQNADDRTRPITLVFALIGLYLHAERGFTGRQVQRVHMRLAQGKRSWPVFERPQNRGTLTPSWVMATPAGPERDRAIDAWCRSVWDAYRSHRDRIVGLLKEYGIE